MQESPRRCVDRELCAWNMGHIIDIISVSRTATVIEPDRVQLVSSDKSRAPDPEKSRTAEETLNVAPDRISLSQKV